MSPFTSRAPAAHRLHDAHVNAWHASKRKPRAAALYRATQRNYTNGKAVQFIDFLARS